MSSPWICRDMTLLMIVCVNVFFYDGTVSYNEHQTCLGLLGEAVFVIRKSTPNKHFEKNKNEQMEQTKPKM